MEGREIKRAAKPNFTDICSHGEGDSRRRVKESPRWGMERCDARGQES